MAINKTPNRLINETSPYLLQHAYNPVDWYAWGEEALEKAKAENKVILVSIGYSACHWCHVMERESFEDPETAAIMNALFVNIKIDREERPDLDMIYMDAVQTLSGSGGWPLNCFLTPDGKPFFGGTYFPPVRMHQRSSWKDILHAVQDAWENKQEDVLAQADNLLAQVDSVSKIYHLNDDEVDYEATIQKITKALMSQADKVCGGFGGAPKFPQTYSLQFLLRLFSPHIYKPQNIDTEVRDFVLLSIDKMIQGGIYDQLEGGFARYSTDSRWIAPHFEKMLYDNALLIGLISEAYQLTKFERYKKVVEQTMAFVKNNWLDDDGGFFSALDADSEGVEGKYYTWTYHELSQIIDNDDDLALFCQYYNISKTGNWEHTNILWYNDLLETFCINNQLDVQETYNKLERIKSQLLKVRDQRIKPLLDDKKLMGWNAMMITACVKAYRALGNDEYLEMAEGCIHFIETNMKRVDGSYYHNYKLHKANNEANLEDIAQYIHALLQVKGVKGYKKLDGIIHSAFEYVKDQFVDEDSPYCYYTPKRQKDLVIRKQDFYDGATASSNSMMLLNLKMAQILEVENTQFLIEEKMMKGVKHLMERYPTSFSNWAIGYQLHDENLYIVKTGEEVLNKHRKGLFLNFIPNLYVKSIDNEIVNENIPLKLSAIESLERINLCNRKECFLTTFNFDELIRQLN